jgi:outer membrane PBP1 activator LpoA protein
MTSLDVVASARLAACALLASVACAAGGQPTEPDKPAEAEVPSIALVLPSQATIFAQAAEALRQGFFAAHSSTHATWCGSSKSTKTEQMHAALVAARDRGVRVAVGPLPRGSCAGGKRSRDLQMVTLNYPTATRRRRRR